MDTKFIQTQLRNVAPYFIAAFLSLLYAFLFMRLWNANWGIQFFYYGDAMFYDMLIKGIAENGWHLSNQSLGMPHGTNLYDFPIPDTLTLLLVKLATYFTANQHLILNLFYISTYPLTTITALYVLRQFTISFFPALLASLLYSFTPFHLSRSEVHLTYTVYYIVPLMVLVLLWVCGRGSKTADESQAELNLNLRNPKLIFSLIVCILISSTGGVYYSFFACYFLAVIGIFRAIAYKHIRHLLLPTVLIAAILAALVANLSPNIIYQYTHGKTETAQRAPVEAELYGLKLAQLVLPLTGHRIGSWRRLKDEYNRAPLVNENDDSTLGLIGSIGFLTLLGLLVYSAFDLGRREDKSTLNLLAHLSILNLSALLLGTIGGFSAIFNLLVSPQIRCYNRISVYIAFFSFFAVALTLERARHRFFQSRGLRLALPLLIIILTILGLLDQSSSRLVPDYAGVKHVFEVDADFVQRIESSVPAGAMIFQLPVKRFPETIPIERVYDYDLFKGYIHSKQLRWSYGAMRGRLGDFWQAWVVTHPIPELVEIIALANFDGIYIDRFGYADNAATLESELAGLTESGPLVSKDQRLSFFDLVTYRKKLTAQYSAQELKAKQIETIYPIHPVWEGGFSGLENLPGEQWRWCGPSGQLLLNNYAPYARRITVEMSIATSTEANMRIESPFFTQDMKTYPQPKPFSKTFDIPPGQHRLNFTSDAKRVFAPQDPRILVFRVINFSLKRVG